MDPRINQLAETLVQFSTSLQKQEKVLIECFDVPESVPLALARAARVAGAHPYFLVRSSRVTREFILGGTDQDFQAEAQVELARMQTMDAYVAVRGSHNIFESSDIPGPRMQAYLKAMKPVLDHRVNHTRWVVLRWPTSAMAQQARMSTEAFEDFYFRACTLDYARMQPGMAQLKALMESTDRVHIVGPETDLRFSIKGIPAICCGGQHNIPDGEVFTAPVRESVEGTLFFNAPTVYQGHSFDQIRLVFRKGQVVEATASDSERLNEILDSDPGARYVGEFAIAFHPLILEPMRDILFDEKIAGSFHFTPGQAYEQADNGNRSQVHWDMVSIQRPEWGGGEIRFDDRVIRKDGRFVEPSLNGLNPEVLVS